MTWLRTAFKFRQKSDQDVEKPFLDHLEDLRITLMKMGSILVVCMIGAFCFKSELTRLLEQPLEAVNQSAAVKGIKQDQPLTERERMLADFSALAVSAAGRIAKVVLTPEEQQAIAHDLVIEYRTLHPLPESGPGAQPVSSLAGTAAHEQLQVLSITESFTIALKLAFYAGIVVSFPFQLYFVISFVLPALTRKEKRLLGPGILGGSLLFASGVYVGFRHLLPRTLGWFYEFAHSMNFVSNWKAGDYFSFVTQLCLACGFLCELPLVMVVLSVMNVISFSMLQSTRRFAVAVILILVAIIAPTPDPLTFFTLAVPMLAIFEGSIWLVWLLERRQRRAELSGQTLGD